MDNKKIFITFGAGEKQYIEAGKRLIEQAIKTNYFDKTIFYNESILQQNYKFWKQHSSFILNNKRGYGYWIWKPYIILNSITNMKDGDILMYLDCGCEIGGEIKNNIPTFFEYVKNEKIICSKNGCIIKDWTKMDLLVYLNLEKDDIINKHMYQGGTILLYVCEETRKFIKKWYKICCNYNLIDDSKSISPNLPSFKEHRHDQSVFSLLLRKFKLNSNKNLKSCIHISRNRSGKSKL